MLLGQAFDADHHRSLAFKQVLHAEIHTHAHEGQEVRKRRRHLQLGKLLCHSPIAPIEQGLQQRHLVGEVMQQPDRGDAGDFGHIAHGGCRITVFGEHGGGRIQQGGAAHLALGGTAAFGDRCAGRFGFVILT
ncbi:hypothetical protein D3C79_947810 [compost metagenome]